MYKGFTKVDLRLSELFTKDSNVKGTHYSLRNQDVLETVGSYSHIGSKDVGTVWIKKWWMHL